MLKARMGTEGAAGYLLRKLEQNMGPGKNAEAYVLGDSPLVLLTALQTNWERACFLTIYV